MTASSSLIGGQHPEPLHVLGTPAVDAPEHIPVLRAQIDAIDTAIIRLVSERARLSHRIQAARVAAGGVRIELSRERVVMEGYRNGLGETGTAVAEAVLRACRGPL